MEERLIELGFNEFIHLRSENRDDVRRMAWSGMLQGQIWFVLLSQSKGIWILDFLKNEDDDPELLKGQYLALPNPIEAILKLIQDSKDGR